MIHFGNFVLLSARARNKKVLSNWFRGYITPNPLEQVWEQLYVVRVQNMSSSDTPVGPQYIRAHIAKFSINPLTPNDF